MVTVGMNYEVLEGKGELFESVFNKVLGVMNDMAGHKESHLYKDVANSRKYLIVSEWHTRAAFDEFTRSDRFRGVVNWGKEEVLAARPRHEIYGGDTSPATSAAVAPSAHVAPAGKCPVPH